LEKTVRLNEAFYSFTQASKSLEAYYLKLGEKVQYPNNPVNWEPEGNGNGLDLQDTRGNKRQQDQGRQDTGCQRTDYQKQASGVREKFSRGVKILTGQRNIQRGNEEVKKWGSKKTAKKQQLHHFIAYLLLHCVFGIDFDNKDPEETWTKDSTFFRR